MSHMTDFAKYIEDIVSNNSPEADLLHGYTTFLMLNPANRLDIKDYRMRWFVNNYTNYDNVDKRPYYEYYKNNITDQYSGVFNPPSCIFYKEERQKESEKQEELERYNDDIEVHYREIANRHMRKCHNTNDDMENPEVFDENETQTDDNDISSYTDNDDYYDFDDPMFYEETDYEEDDYDY